MGIATSYELMAAQMSDPRRNKALRKYGSGSDLICCHVCGAWVPSKDRGAHMGRHVPKLGPGVLEFGSSVGRVLDI